MCLLFWYAGKLCSSYESEADAYIVVGCNKMKNLVIYM